jgi:hypothetical protein
MRNRFNYNIHIFFKKNYQYFKFEIKLKLLIRPKKSIVSLSRTPVLFNNNTKIVEQHVYVAVILMIHHWNMILFTIHYLARIFYNFKQNYFFIILLYCKKNERFWSEFRRKKKIIQNFLFKYHSRVYYSVRYWQMCNTKKKSRFIAWIEKLIAFLICKSVHKQDRTWKYYIHKISHFRFNFRYAIPVILI